MLKDEIVEIRTTWSEKFLSNLPCPFIDQTWFQDKDDIRLTIHLLDFDRPLSFYKLPSSEKLERLCHIKNVATEFFKIGNFQKACKFY